MYLCFLGEKEKKKKNGGLFSGVNESQMLLPNRIVEERYYI